MGLEEIAAGGMIRWSIPVTVAYDKNTTLGRLLEAATDEERIAAFESLVRTQLRLTFDRLNDDREEFVIGLPA